MLFTGIRGIERSVAAVYLGQAVGGRPDVHDRQTDRQTSDVRQTADSIIA